MCLSQRKKQALGLQVLGGGLWELHCGWTSSSDIQVDLVVHHTAHNCSSMYKVRYLIEREREVRFTGTAPSFRTPKMVAAVLEWCSEVCLFCGTRDTVWVLVFSVLRDAAHHHPQVAGRPDEPHADAGPGTHWRPRLQVRLREGRMEVTTAGPSPEECRVMERTFRNFRCFFICWFKHVLTCCYCWTLKSEGYISSPFLSLSGKL